MDAHANFGYGVVDTPPDPAASGTNLTLSVGQGQSFATPPFNVVACAPDVRPLNSNAEILRVTAIDGDTFTIIRGPQADDPGGSNQNIDVGWQIFDAVTVKLFTDIEKLIHPQVFLFADASSEWTCVHNLGRYPIVAVFDSEGNSRPLVPMSNPDLNTTVLTPNPPLAGQAVIS